MLTLQSYLSLKNQCHVVLATFDDTVNEQAHSEMEFHFHSTPSRPSEAAARQIVSSLLNQLRDRADMTLVVSKLFAKVKKNECTTSFSYVECTKTKLLHTTCYTIKPPINQLPFLITKTLQQCQEDFFQSVVQR